ncbi:hypothetical protein CAPTEDRAFT_215559 [Capitella teleta]|uniref:Uncharacterized protein n=1 Tax=Capitella teleta TaxID=283909 RepID=R7UHM2_CAPTE|nr:hypothetical protein CAPTEDRAFT_215559 [Capitella teleta]|eukprot:ELU02777.1 hypothetical protein CAPTEDRAFT_215559 [Capitella teleta]
MDEGQESICPVCSDRFEKAEKPQRGFKRHRLADVASPYTRRKVFEVDLAPRNFICNGCFKKMCRVTKRVTVGKRKLYTWAGDRTPRKPRKRKTGTPKAVKRKKSLFQRSHTNSSSSSSQMDMTPLSSDLTPVPRPVGVLVDDPVRELVGKPTGEGVQEYVGKSVNDTSHEIMPPSSWYYTTNILYRLTLSVHFDSTLHANITELPALEPDSVTSPDNTTDRAMKYLCSYKYISAFRLLIKSSASAKRALVQVAAEIVKQELSQATKHRKCEML